MLFIALLILAAAVAYGIQLQKSIDDTIDQITAGADEHVPEEQLAKKKPLAILLLGLDSRPVVGGLNTDVIMVAALNPEQKSAVVVSVPRDTYVKVEGWRARKANSFYANVYDRDNLRDTYAQMKEVFGKFFGIPIDYVTVVNFNTLVDLVDAVGGIHVEVDQDMRYVDPTDGTDINLRAGPQDLDGKKALDFVRYRHSNHGETPESSDFDRNRRQQVVVGAIVDRLKSFNTLVNFNPILDAIGNNIHTDLPKAQIRSLIQTYLGISSERIRFIALEGSWRSPYVYLDEASFAQAKQALSEQLSDGGSDAEASRQ
jgi:cell envelope-related function transcriptional attenuator common domain